MRRPCLLLALVLWLLSVASAPGQEREPSEVYPSRRAALAQRLPDGLIVLLGNEEAPGSEAFHRFWQESNFYYLTGFHEPGAALLLAPPRANAQSPEVQNSPPREILFLPAKNPQQEGWTGPKPNPDDPATPSRLGFAAVQPVSSLDSEIRRFASEFTTVYTVLPNPHGSETEQAVARGRVEKLRALVPAAHFKDVRPALAALRQVKSDTELRLIRRAVDCSVAAHLAAGRELRPGLFEYEIAALMKYTFERAGCERPSFDPIVASGARSTILHYNKNAARMESGDVVVVDVGGEYGRYAADITRTLPVNGRFTVRQREVYEIVLGAQNAALSAVKPGMKISGRGDGSLYRIAYDYLNSHGKDRHGEPLGKYFTHGLSHHVGLDVHDTAEPGAAIEPGMVITIEPGIYLPEENLGVRIEDMVLVTKTGYELLSERLPREVAEIEEWLKR